MSVKTLLGLEETDLSDVEIQAKLKEALAKNLDTIEFTDTNGKKIIVRLPHRDFSKYIDPWDDRIGKGNYPHV